MASAGAASGTPIVVVLRPPQDVEGMERTAAFQEKCWQAGFPVFPTIPRAANAIAKTLRWARGRQSRSPLPVAGLLFGYGLPLTAAQELRAQVSPIWPDHGAEHRIHRYRSEHRLVAQRLEHLPMEQRRYVDTAGVPVGERNIQDVWFHHLYFHDYIHTEFTLN